MVGHTRRDCEASKTFAKVAASSVLSSGRGAFGEATSEPMGLEDAHSPRESRTGGSCRLVTSS